MHPKAGFGGQVADFFSNLFNTSSWPPRWHCGTWTDFHGWLYIISDLLIWASYFAIPILLIRLVRGRPDIPFPKIVWLFIAFIIFCGTTHLIDAVIFWWPAYRLSALIRFFTAIISMVAVYVLFKVMPLILSLRSVKELEFEINQRQAAETALSKSHQLLFESHQQLKSFTHILSHNIRNHASNITLLATLVNVEMLDEANMELFDKLSKVSQGLNATLNDLSEAIMIRESTIAPDILDFGEVTNKVLDILGSELSMKNVTVETDFEIKTVLFPRLYMESVLMNLISNAIKYRKESELPHIKLRSYKSVTGNIVLECIDNGVGVDLNLHGSKIFGLYKTFHANKDAHGVGLFLIKTQIESQGGKISVVSEVGKGATFKVIFNPHPKK